MAIRILANSGQVERALRRLLSRYPRYSWAVAWGSYGFPACDLLLRNRDRIQRLVIGTHFYQTHPDLIESLLGHDRTRFVLSPSGVFHPKLYLFEDGARWECVVGSPNFTRGGLGKNAEIAVLISDGDRDAADALVSLKAAIEQYWEKGEPLDAAGLEGYRAMWQAKAVLREQLGDNAARGPGEPGDRGLSALEVSILRMPWAEFVAGVGAERKGITLAGRLAVLDYAREQFHRGVPFSGMGDEARKRIAGTTHEKFKKDGEDPDWLWFGSMKGAGIFKGLVRANSPLLSDALDAIPLAGDVTKAHYERFLERFLQAFEGRPVADRVGCATRLLAMKRPDYFLCLDSRNRAGLRKAFKIRGPLGLGQYWDSIVERIRSAAWWLADAPATEEEARIWQGRAAMLDALYYEGQ